MPDACPVAAEWMLFPDQLVMNGIHWSIISVLA